MLISCNVCAKQIADSALTCPGCGAAQDGVRSPKSFNVTLTLSVILSSFHRFYVGKVGTGFLMMFTGGGVGVWTLIDIIKICTKKFRDAEGRLVLPPKLGPISFSQTLGRAILLGFLGIHRFYVGKYGTGLLMLFTFGCLGVWQLIDIVMICTKNFKDAEGRLVIPEN